VPDLDMAEVGTENREWITYMLRSCAVFGAGTVSKKKPSFVGVGSFDTFLKQTTNNFLQYLELTATAQIQAEALQSIAEDEAKTKAAMLKAAWDESQHPRDKEGQFTEAGAGTEAKSGDPEGSGPARVEWNKRNKAVMEATDVYIDTREAHRALVERLNAEYQAETPMGYPEAGYAAYKKSQATLEQANQALAQAETALKQQEPLMRKEIVQNLATDVASDLGVDPRLIDVVDEAPHPFTVGDKQFTEAGHYDPTTKRIQLNSNNISYANAPGVKGVVAHEISHAIYHQLKIAAEEEFQRYLVKATTEDAYTPWFHERFTTDPHKIGRQVKPEYAKEMAEEFPASTVLARLSGGDIFSGITDEMIAENGHSRYAKSYWAAEAEKRIGLRNYRNAINETIAEITRWLAYPRSWEEEKPPDLDSPWVKLTESMLGWHQRQQAEQARQFAASLASGFRA